MNDKQIKQFISFVLISDVISYIDAHKKEYEQFLKDEIKNTQPKKINRKARKT